MVKNHGEIIGPGDDDCGRDGQRGREAEVLPATVIEKLQSELTTLRAERDRWQEITRQMLTSLICGNIEYEGDEVAYEVSYAMKITELYKEIKQERNALREALRDVLSGAFEVAQSFSWQIPRVEFMATREKLLEWKALLDAGEKEAGDG